MTDGGVSRQIRYLMHVPDTPIKFIPAYLKETLTQLSLAKRRSNMMISMLSNASDLHLIYSVVISIKYCEIMPFSRSYCSMLFTWSPSMHGDHSVLFQAPKERCPKEKFSEASLSGSEGVWGCHSP